MSGRYGVFREVSTNNFPEEVAFFRHVFLCVVEFDSFILESVALLLAFTEIGGQYLVPAWAGGFAE